MSVHEQLHVILGRGPTQPSQDDGSGDVVEVYPARVLVHFPGSLHTRDQVADHGCLQFSSDDLVLVCEEVEVLVGRILVPVGRRHRRSHAGHLDIFRAKSAELEAPDSEAIMFDRNGLAILDHSLHPVHVELQDLALPMLQEESGEGHFLAARQDLLAEPLLQGLLVVHGLGHFEASSSAGLAEVAPQCLTGGSGRPILLLLTPLSMKL